MAEHYFTSRPTSPQKKETIRTNLRGLDLQFTTSSGVFSASGIDKGTAVLIEYAQIEGNEHLLDLGCGYGPVGIALKKAFPSLQVTCSDINERAVFSARENSRNNHVEIKTVISDGFVKIPDEFDTILLNPPQSAGRDVCERLIKESFEHLKKGGNFQLVARHQKGGATLANIMESIFGNVATVKTKSGYRVYISKKD
ncbi:MAG TPA: methyltransferase [Candidatus Nanoarchaeia archaeon]|nr:methyltransferase [Candidatus Nanoarchaeia archaeon]